jgi:heat shock protein HslJ
MTYRLGMAISRLTTVLLAPAVLLVGALTMSACGSTSAPADAGAASPATTAGLSGTSWVLESYAGPDGEAVAAVADGEVGTLVFAADGSFAGSTGCNRIMGTYTQDGSSLTFASGPMTLKACQGPVAAQEAAIVAALPLVASFTQESSLVLQDAEGATLLTYAPGLSTLAGTSWQATGINNGKEAVVGTDGTGQVTLAFGADGTVSGSGGCNSYSGPYTTSGADQLTIGTLASTMKACEEPVMETEQMFFAALENVATYQLEGSTLTLRDAGGATQATFTLVP